MTNNNSYFNTTSLFGDDLKACVSQAVKQDDRVLAIFKIKGCELTPAEAWAIYCDCFPDCPLTSIRRSITVLTDKGKLIKTGEMKDGIFGKPNYKWRAA